MKTDKTFTDTRHKNSANLATDIRIQLRKASMKYWFLLSEFCLDLLRNHLPWDSHTAPSSSVAETTSADHMTSLALFLTYNFLSLG